MPHVSRHVPQKKISDRTLDLFVECITAKWSENERRIFLLDLLTPTERIMFSKRLAIIYMLAKGHSFDTIQDTLRVSPSTIARFWNNTQKGKYVHIVERIQRQVKKQDIAQGLMDMVPPMHMSKKQYIERMRRLNIY